MNKSSTLRSGLVVILVVLAIVLVYFYMDGKSSSVPASGLLEGVQSGAGLDNSVELSLLNQIKELRIDTAIFGNDAFVSLESFSVQIPRENIGRPNPFAPIPGVQSNPSDVRMER